MSHRVELTATAQREVVEAYHWLLNKSEAHALEWYEGLTAAVATLGEFPTRCGLAAENAEYTEEIRQLLYGKRGGRYRILFVVRGKVVYVLHLRHGARHTMRASEIDPGPPQAAPESEKGGER